MSAELLYQLFSGPLPALGGAFVVVFAFLRIHGARRAREEERRTARERATAVGAYERAARLRDATEALRRAQASGTAAELPEYARVLEAFIRAGGVTADEARARWSEAVASSSGMPPMVLGEPETVTPLPGFRPAPSSWLSETAKVMAGLENWKDAPPDQDELSARLAGTIAAANFNVREKELKTERANSEFMVGDPLTCGHLMAENVKSLAGVVVARLCPACGAQLELEEE